MPASRRARAITFAPRSCPSRPGLATNTRIGRVSAIVADSFRANLFCQSGSIERANRALQFFVHRSEIRVPFYKGAWAAASVLQHLRLLNDGLSQFLLDYRNWQIR